MKTIAAGIAGCALIFTLGSAVIAAASADGTEARLERVLAATPLIDGHNDLPWQLRIRDNGKLASINLAADTSHLPSPEGEVALMTDIPRLKAGHVGGQFWSVWIPPETRGPEAVQMTMEQIDLVKRLVALYPADLEMAYTAADIRRIHHAHRIASMIGIEGGHQINNSLAALRQMYDLGARYMTLTHTLTTDWADSATDTPKYHGLSAFGIEVVHEMNRIGMLVDLSHVSAEVMRTALKESAAPVMFSHSSARALADHPRNVPDDVLHLVAEHGGVVMVNFNSGYVSEEVRRWDADEAAEKARENSPPYDGLYIGQPEKAKAAHEAWLSSHPMPRATLSQVADHADYIRKIAGIDHVGLGSDFDGISNTPIGLEAVDKFPALLEELMRRGWSDTDIAKIAGENVLRVLSEAEKVSARLRTERGASETLLGPSAAPH